MAVGPSLPASLYEAVQRLRCGTLSVADCLNALCDRIDALEPQVRALLPEADRRGRLLADAAVLEQRYPDPDQRPPLFGIPVGVKDVFRVDGFPTRAGSQLPAELFDGPEAACVTCLLRAGALILGKTVTTESPLRARPTRNPRNMSHTPGGSSSGSAAAVAAGFCPLALGTPAVRLRHPARRLLRDRRVQTELRPRLDERRDPLRALARPHRLLVPEPADLALPLTGPLMSTRRCPGGVTSAFRNLTWSRRRPRLGLSSKNGSVRSSASWTVKRIKVLENIADVNAWNQSIAAYEMARTHAVWFEEHELSTDRALPRRYAPGSRRTRTSTRPTRVSIR